MHARASRGQTATQLRSAPTCQVMQSTCRRPLRHQRAPGTAGPPASAVRRSAAGSDPTLEVRCACGWTDRSRRLPGLRRACSCANSPPATSSRRTTSAAARVRRCGRRARLLSLSSYYSPDVTPVEIAFSQPKAQLGRSAEWTVAGSGSAIGRLVEGDTPNARANISPLQDPNQVKPKRPSFLRRRSGNASTDLIGYESPRL